MDPQQRLLLEVAWEALEDAGQSVDELAGSDTGVFVGVHSHSEDYYLLQAVDPAALDLYSGTGTSHAVLSGRLSYLLDLRGPEPRHRHRLLVVARRGAPCRAEPA